MKAIKKSVTLKKENLEYLDTLKEYRETNFSENLNKVVAEHREISTLGKMLIDSLFSNKEILTLKEYFKIFKGKNIEKKMLLAEILDTYEFEETKDKKKIMELITKIKKLNDFEFHVFCSYIRNLLLEGMC